MKTRYSYGGDEHIFVEMDEEMSLNAFFKALFITNAVRDAKIKGVSEESARPMPRCRSSSIPT